MDLLMGVILGSTLAFTGLWLAGLVLRIVFAKKYPVPKAGSAIVITGASTGIGNHAAIFLAKRGYVVYAGVRKREDQGNLNALKIPNLRPIILDVEKPESIEKAVADITAALERDGLPLGALINNAGIAQKYPVEFHPMSAMRRIFEVHYFGPMDLTQKLLPLLRKSKGRVVFVGSFTALVTVPLVGGYGASKNALESVADAMRVELAEHEVSVSLLEPAYVSSTIFQKVAKEIDEEIEVSEEIMQLYGWFFRPVKRAKDKQNIASAASPEVTSRAFYHAISSAYPKARYVVANVGPLPAWILVFMQWLLPTRVRDAVVMATS